MAGKTYAHSDAVLNVLAGTSLTAPGGLWAALLHTNPTVDDMTSAVETTYTNYVRLTIGALGSAWSAISNGAGSTRQRSNANLLTFATAGATGDTGMNGFALANNSSTALTTAGVALYWNVITGAPKVINAGDPVSVAIGALVATED